MLRTVEIPDTLPTHIVRELEVEQILEESKIRALEYVLNYNAKRGAE